MPKKSTHVLIDEIVKDIKEYRCKYLEILIEKYVKTGEDEKEIDIKSVQLYKNTKSVKKFKTKSFGSVSSYYCESANKNIHCLKKKVYLHKKELRKKASQHEESQCEESQCEDSQYEVLSEYEESQYEVVSECDKTQCEESESEESEYEESECNNRKQNNYQFRSTTKRSNRIHSGKKKQPPVSSNCAKTLSKKQNKSFTENVAKKPLVINGQNYSLSENFKQFSNSGDNAKSLKFKNKELKVLIEKFSSTGDDSSNYKAPKIEYERMAVHFKDISYIRNHNSNISSAFTNSIGRSFYENSLNKSFPKFSLSNIGIGIPNKFCQDFNVSNGKLLSSKSIVPSKFNSGKKELKTPIKNNKIVDVYNVKSLHYTPSKSVVVPSKFSSGKKESKTFFKNNETVDVYNVKSLHYMPNKSVVSPPISCNKIGIKTSNKNCQTLLNCLPVETTCLLPSLNVNTGNSRDIEKTVQKQVSSEGKFCEKKSSTKSTLSCKKTDNSEKCTGYYKENVPIDDLSFRKISNKKKTDKYK